MRRLLPVALCIPLLLTACANNDVPPPTPTPNAVQSGGPSFSDLKTQADVAAMVPGDISSSGTLRVGISPTMAPAQYEGAQSGEYHGYTIALMQAVTTVMGVDVEFIKVDFPELIRGVGKDYDVAASSLSVTPERLEQANMVTYATVDSSFVVATSPKTPLADDFPCGAAVSVLKGTSQQRILATLSAECVEDDAKPISITEYSSDQKEMFSDVSRGTIAAAFTDSDSAQHAVKNSLGRLRLEGTPISPQPQGVAVPITNAQLTVAIQAAIQYLLDNGYVEAIFQSYQVSEIAVNQSMINPRVN